MDVDERRRRVLAAVGGMVPIGVAGCAGLQEELDGTIDEYDGDDGDDGNGDHDHDRDSNLGDPEAEVEVGMVTGDGHHFDPHVVHIEQGGTVTWALESGSHDTTAYHPDTHRDQQRIPDDAEPWASDLLAEQGDTFERTFDVEGVYDYACTPHEGLGMVGSIVVGWPDPEGQPGLEPPAEGIPETAAGQLEDLNEQVRGVLEDGQGGE